MPVESVFWRFHGNHDPVSSPVPFRRNSGGNRDIPVFDARGQVGNVAGPGDVDAEGKQRFSMLVDIGIF